MMELYMHGATTASRLFIRCMSYRSACMWTDEWKGRLVLAADWCPSK